MQPSSPDDWIRLQAVPSPATRIAEHVDDFSRVTAADTPQWLRVLGIPEGWQLAALNDYDAPPARTAVRVPASTAGGFGFETISVYTFTGLVRSSTVTKYADCTLRGLNAANVTARAVSMPPLPEVTAVCATGRLDISGFAVAAQYCTYVAGSTATSGGLLVEHGLLVDARWLTELSSDVAELSRGVQAAFSGTITAP